MEERRIGHLWVNPLIVRVAREQNKKHRPTYISVTHTHLHKTNAALTTRVFFWYIYIYKIEEDARHALTTVRDEVSVHAAWEEAAAIPIAALMTTTQLHAL